MAGTQGNFNEELMKAVDSGDVERARGLLAGGNANDTDSSGNAMVLRAVMNEDAPMVALLLQNGANPNARTAHGMTGLMLAAEQKREDIAREFVRAFADLGMTNEDGKTAADIASTSNASTIRVMLEIKKQQKIFNLVANIRAKAEHHKEEHTHEAEKVKSFFGHIADGIASLALAGVVAASKFNAEEAERTAKPFTQFDKGELKLEPLPGSSFLTGGSAADKSASPANAPVNTNVS